MARITNHPILKASEEPTFSFTFDGQTIEAMPGEMISSALFGAGIRVFGQHPKDGAPQGIFCANGQCSQSMVIANGVPVKSCMTAALPGMSVQSMTALPTLPEVSEASHMSGTEILDVDVLIIGGGPAGMSAALELSDSNVDVLLVDDKDRLGGKLVLQTHKFFGSINAVYAGTRGVDIGARLAAQIEEKETVTIWLSSTAVAVFNDGFVGVLNEDRYVLVRPRMLLTATGAREKALVFPGNTLPGVYGAGAFQTLVNRDLIKASERLFIVGGGNVGLIAGYHALQAGIDVVGLVEALPECGGYKVHRDKLARMGVPIHTSHTVLSANGTEAVESVTIVQINDKFQPIEGTEQTFACDTVLIAVGLDPVDEFTLAAEKFGLKVYAAGDAEEIAEASAAIFSGRITGRQIALDLGVTQEPIPDEWARTSTILKSKPGKTIERATSNVNDSTNQTFRDNETLSRKDRSFGAVFPVFHCTQEIPCNPCSSVCPQGLIHIDEDDIRQVPEYVAEKIGKECIGCMKCVTICPGLAITLLDGRADPAHPAVTIPFEFGPHRLEVGDTVVAMDVGGTILCEVPVLEVRNIPSNDCTVLVKVQAPRDIAERIAGLRVQQPWIGESLPEVVQPLEDADIVCRCERVTAGEIREVIRNGCRDLNEMKTLTRAGMGACGGKTCQMLILRLFRECGVSMDDVTGGVPRPLFVEVPLGVFANSTPRELSSYEKAEEAQPSRAGNEEGVEG